MKLSHKSLILTLKVCVFLIFIGRAYQYLFFDAPFRALLWDEGLLQPLVEGLFNTPWNDYVTSMKADAWINRIIGINGIIYVIAAFSALFINVSNKKHLKYPIRIGAFLLVLLSFLSAKDKFYHYGQFFEHAIQFGLPFILLMAVNTEINIKRISLYLKVLIAVTFTAHALYALGYYPIPGYFIDMTISILNVTEDTALLILHTVGVLDILLSILIFVPKIAKYALIYAFVWGLMTAFARALAFFNADYALSSFHQSIYLVVYRLAHGIIPLLVYFIDYRLHNNNTLKFK